jgi:hypothetical protein
MLNKNQRNIVIKQRKKNDLLSIYYIPDFIFNNVTGFSKLQLEWEYSPKKFGKEIDEKKAKRRGLRGHLYYNETFYIALIKNYRDMGWFAEADDCYYTYRVEKRKHRLNELNEVKKEGENNPSTIGRWWDKAKLYGEWTLLDLTFGYGVKPLKLLKTYLFIWLVFILIYMAFLRLQYQNGKKSIWQWPRKLLRSTVHSLDTLTPGINLYAFTELRPFYFDTTKSWKKLILNTFQRGQQIFGWYLAALFLILFTRIWIR